MTGSHIRRTCPGCGGWRDGGWTGNGSPVIASTARNRDAHVAKLEATNLRERQSRPIGPCGWPRPCCRLCYGQCWRYAEESSKGGSSEKILFHELPLHGVPAIKIQLVPSL